MFKGERESQQAALVILERFLPPDQVQEIIHLLLNSGFKPRQIRNTLRKYIKEQTSRGAIEGVRRKKPEKEVTEEDLKRIRERYGPERG